MWAQLVFLASCLVLMVQADCGLAVCFSGHMRTFNTGDHSGHNRITVLFLCFYACFDQRMCIVLAERTQRYLVNALADGNICGSDVFGIVRMATGEQERDAIALAVFVRVFSPIRIAAFNENSFPARKIDDLVWIPPNPSSSELSKLHGSYVWKENPLGSVENARVQYTTVAACFDLVRSHEHMRADKYEWVVRTRSTPPSAHFFFVGTYKLILPLYI